MKNYNLLLNILALPLMVTGFACAGQESMSTAPVASLQSNSDMGGWIGLSAAFGEATADLTSVGFGSATAEVVGVRLDGGFIFGGGFSLDGRYQYLEDDGDGNIHDFRSILNYKLEFVQGFSGFVGAGYEYQILEITEDLELDQQAVLANIGVEFKSGSFFSTLSYTHGFTTSSELDGGFGVFVGSVDLRKEDTGNVELMTGYEFTPHLSTIFTIKADVLGDAAISEDWITTLGVRYTF